MIQRRSVWRYVVAALGVTALVLVLARVAGIWWNGTASAPRGFWRMAGRDWSTGDLVLVDVPANDALFREARSRGYLQPAWTRSGCAPLLKRVIAVSGDMVEVSDRLRVNGREIGGSVILAVDRRGRPLWRNAESGRVPADRVWVISEEPRSGFDSRYFGALPTGLVRGRVVRAWSP